MGSASNQTHRSSPENSKQWFEVTQYFPSRSGEGPLLILRCKKCGETTEFEPQIEGIPPETCPNCGYKGLNG